MSQTVLVIKDEAILAASGKEGKSPQFKKLEKIELKGFGESFSRWKEGIQKLSERMELGQVRLVLPASMCAAKVIELPWVKNRELGAMALREMQESFRSEIMDYAVIESDKKTGIVLAGASVEENVLKQFLAMFEELEVEVKSVTAPMEGLLRMLPHLEGYGDRTAVYLFFEEGAVTSVLCENGKYKYSSRSRLFSEPGTLDYGTEIVRNVSGILQFHAASKSEHPITEVYYAGCPEDVFEVSREQLALMNLAVHRIGEMKGIHMPYRTECSEWYSCIGAMLNSVKGIHDINLLSSYKKNSEKEVKDTALWHHAVLPVAALALCGVIYGGIQIMNAGAQKRIDESAAWMESEDVRAVYDEAKELEEHREALNQAASLVKYTEQSKGTYPKLDNRVLTRIQAAGGSGITSHISAYDSENGEMTFVAKSMAAIDIPSYIQRLTQTNLFHTVEYTGYVFENDAYTLSLRCTMEENDEGGAE